MIMDGSETFLKETVTAMATCWTSAAYAGVTAQVAWAASICMRATTTPRQPSMMAHASSALARDAQTRWRATSTRPSPRTTVHACTSTNAACVAAVEFQKVNATVKAL